MSATPEIRGPWCVYCGAEPADEHGECADCRAWWAGNQPPAGTPTGGSDAAQGLPPSPSRVAALPRAGVRTEPIDATAPAGTAPSRGAETHVTQPAGAGPTESEE